MTVSIVYCWTKKCSAVAVLSLFVQCFSFLELIITSLFLLAHCSLSLVLPDHENNVNNIFPHYVTLKVWYWFLRAISPGAHCPPATQVSSWDFPEPLVWFPISFVSLFLSLRPYFEVHLVVTSCKPSAQEVIFLSSCMSDKIIFCVLLVGQLTDFGVLGWT